MTAVFVLADLSVADPRYRTYMIKVSLISLGCAKNLVDSEIMVGHLHQAGMTVIPEAEKADVVIVNTCSFIDSSKEESIGHILEVHQHKGMKKRRKEQKLIVAGCMSQRFSKDLSSELHDEVDAFIGLDQVTKVAPIIEAIYAKERGKGEAKEGIGSRPRISPTSRSPRAATTPAPSASSRRSAAATAAAPSTASSRRPAASSRRASRS
jgi:ribosomal protein S12 methylthiotransferase